MCDGNRAGRVVSNEGNKRIANWVFEKCTASDGAVLGAHPHRTVRLLKESRDAAEECSLFNWKQIFKRP